MKIELTRKDLQLAVGAVQAHASKDKSDPEIIHAINVKISVGRMVFEATDRYSVGRYVLRADEIDSEALRTAEETSFRVYAKEFWNAVKSVKKTEEREAVVLEVTGDSLVIWHGENKTVLQLVTGNYPPLDKIVSPALDWYFDGNFSMSDVPVQLNWEHMDKISWYAKKTGLFMSVGVMVKKTEEYSPITGHRRGEAYRKRYEPVVVTDNKNLYVVIQPNWFTEIAQEKYRSNIR